MSVFMEQYHKRLGGNTYYYGNASHAIHDILTWLQKISPKKKPNVVLPVFIPAKMFRLVLSAGYFPKFYEVFDHCQIDMNEIESLIDDQTQAVMGIHYFGRLAPVVELRELCDVKRVHFIEDCAHVLLSQLNGVELGTFGDSAVFSTRKMLLTPAGGFLVINREIKSFAPTYVKHVNNLYTLTGLLKTRSKHKLLKITKGKDPFGMSHIPKVGYINVSENHRFKIKGASLFNILYTQNVDLNRVAVVRRSNYRYLEEELSDLKRIQPLSSSISSRMYSVMTPYSFPVLVPKGTRKNLQLIMQKNGITCGAGWPESPFNFSAFPRTEVLSKCLFELPIHQGVNRNQLERMNDIMHSFDKGIHNQK